MGKTASTIPQGKFILRTPRVKDENQAYPIYLYYYCGGRQIRESTSICAKVDDWNKDKGELLSSYGQDYIKRNKSLQKLLHKVDNCIFEYVEKNGRITPDVIRRFVSKDFTELRSDRGQNFLDYARMQLEKKYKNKKVRISTYKNDVTNINQFEKYLSSKCHDMYTSKKKNLFVGDINEDVVRDFLCWGLDRGRKKDTVAKYLETICKICKCASEQGYLSSVTAQAIADIKLVQDLDDEDSLDIKYLTSLELGKLVHIDKTKLTDKQAVALELFLFAFYSCGLRVSDLISLRWGDIDLEKKEINKIQVKTRGRNTVPLCSEAVEILKRWQGKHKVFVFGLLSDDFDLNDEEMFRMRRNCITSGLNRKLKKISEIAQINQKVTCHVARHSFAVHSLEQGMSINMISTLLGHSSTLITEKVYARFLDSTKADAVRNLKFDF